MEYCFSSASFHQDSPFLLIIFWQFFVLSFIFSWNSESFTGDEASFGRKTFDAFLRKNTQYNLSHCALATSGYRLYKYATRAYLQFKTKYVTLNMIAITRVNCKQVGYKWKMHNVNYATKPSLIHVVSSFMFHSNYAVGRWRLKNISNGAKVLFTKCHSSDSLQLALSREL